MNEQELHALISHPIFHNLSIAELNHLSNCFCFYKRTYQKDEYILLEGDTVETIGLILDGIVLMEKSDIKGNNYFFTELREHEVFADPFMGEALLHSSVNYKAVVDTQIVFFKYHTMWKPCRCNCSYHTLFIENVMNLLALKTRRLLAKIEVLSQRSLRDKIIVLLKVLQHHEDIFASSNYLPLSSTTSDAIYVPFTRTEMAEYLCVNRSALVRELGNMKKEGILTYNKNTFLLHNH